MSLIAQILLTNLAVVMACLFVLWIVATIRRDVSVVDPFWGAGFMIVAWISRQLAAPASLRVTLLAVLCTLWGLRLALFLLWRNWGAEEDSRYAKMREQQKDRFWWLSLFTVFLLQAVILWFVSFPVQFAAVFNTSDSLGWLDAAGIALWTLGVFFEATGDWQLARFKADPSHKGHVMDRGLWKYTRHPNYFGDFCVWWGLYLIASAGGAYWTIASPLIMSLLLMKVSGVGLLEKTIGDRRPDYAAYKARTNAFFPGPPRRS